MNALSLFKVQSLVAILLCTSVSTWAATTPPDKPKPDSKDKSTITDAERKRYVDLCVDADVREDDCDKAIDALGANLNDGTGNNACRDNSDRANTAQSNFTSANESYFSAVNSFTDATINKHNTDADAAAAVATAQQRLDVAMTAITTSLPIAKNQAQDKAKQDMIKAKGEVLKIAQAEADASDIRIAAQAKYDAAVADMQATCTTFAGSKANNKLDGIDKGNNALLNNKGVYVNNSMTSLSGTKKRRDAKRAQDAQAVYMSAYANCMAGKTDPNGGEVGDGPKLMAAVQEAARGIPIAEQKYQSLMANLEEQRKLALEQMDAIQTQLNNAFDALTVKAANDAKAASAEFETARIAAVNAAEKGSFAMSAKTQMMQQQIQAAQTNASQSYMNAQKALANASKMCGDAVSSTTAPQFQLPGVTPAAGVH